MFQQLLEIAFKIEDLTHQLNTSNLENINHLTLINSQLVKFLSLLKDIHQHNPTINLTQFFHAPFQYTNPQSDCYQYLQRIDNLFAEKRRRAQCQLSKTTKNKNLNPKSESASNYDGCTLLAIMIEIYMNQASVNYSFQIESKYPTLASGPSLFPHNNLSNFLVRSQSTIKNELIDLMIDNTKQWLSIFNFLIGKCNCLLNQCLFCGKIILYTKNITDMSHSDWDKSRPIGIARINKYHSRNGKNSNFNFNNNKNVGLPQISDGLHPQTSNVSLSGLDSSDEHDHPVAAPSGQTQYSRAWMQNHYIPPIAAATGHGAHGGYSGGTSYNRAGGVGGSGLGLGLNTGNASESESVHGLDSDTESLVGLSPRNMSRNVSNVSNFSTFSQNNNINHSNIVGINNGNDNVSVMVKADCMSFDFDAHCSLFEYLFRDSTKYFFMKLLNDCVPSEMPEYINSKLNKVYNEFIYNVYKAHCNATGSIYQNLRCLYSIQAGIDINTIAVDMDRSVSNQDVNIMSCDVYMPVLFEINKYVLDKEENAQNQGGARKRYQEPRIVFTYFDPILSFTPQFLYDCIFTGVVPIQISPLSVASVNKNENIKTLHSICEKKLESLKSNLKKQSAKYDSNNYKTIDVGHNRFNKRNEFWIIIWAIVDINQKCRNDLGNILMKCLDAYNNTSQNFNPINPSNPHHGIPQHLQSIEKSFSIASMHDPFVPIVPIIVDFMYDDLSSLIPLCYSLEWLSMLLHSCFLPSKMSSLHVNVRSAVTEYQSDIKWLQSYCLRRLIENDTLWHRQFDANMSFAFQRSYSTGSNQSGIGGGNINSLGTPKSLGRGYSGMSNNSAKSGHFGYNSGINYNNYYTTTTGGATAASPTGSFGRAEEKEMIDLQVNGNSNNIGSNNLQSSMLHNYDFISRKLPPKLHVQITEMLLHSVQEYIPIAQYGMQIICNPYLISRDVNNVLASLNLERDFSLGLGFDLNINPGKSFQGMETIRSIDSLDEIDQIEEPPVKTGANNSPNTTAQNQNESGNENDNGNEDEEQKKQEQQQANQVPPSKVSGLGIGSRAAMGLALDLNMVHSASVESSKSTVSVYSNMVRHCCNVFKDYPQYWTSLVRHFLSFEEYVGNKPGTNPLHKVNQNQDLNIFEVPPKPTINNSDNNNNNGSNVDGMINVALASVDINVAIVNEEIKVGRDMEDKELAKSYSDYCELCLKWLFNKNVIPLHKLYMIDDGEWSTIIDLCIQCQHFDIINWLLTVEIPLKQPFGKKNSKGAGSPSHADSLSNLQLPREPQQLMVKTSSIEFEVPNTALKGNLGGGDGGSLKLLCQKIDIVMPIMIQYLRKHHKPNMNGLKYGLKYESIVKNLFDKDANNRNIFMYLLNYSFNNYDNNYSNDYISYKSFQRQYSGNSVMSTSSTGMENSNSYSRLSFDTICDFLEYLVKFAKNRLGINVITKGLLGSVIDINDIGIYEKDSDHPDVETLSKNRLQLKSSPTKHKVDFIRRFMLDDDLISYSFQWCDLAIISKFIDVIKEHHVSEFRKYIQSMSNASKYLIACVMSVRNDVSDIQPSFLEKWLFIFENLNKDNRCLYFKSLVKSNSVPICEAFKFGNLNDIYEILSPTSEIRTKYIKSIDFGIKDSHGNDLFLILLSKYVDCIRTFQFIDFGKYFEILKLFLDEYCRFHQRKKQLIAEKLHNNTASNVKVDKQMNLFELGSISNNLDENMFDIICKLDLSDITANMNGNSNLGAEYNYGYNYRLTAQSQFTDVLDEKAFNNGDINSNNSDINRNEQGENVGMETLEMKKVDMNVATIENGGDINAKQEEKYFSNVELFEFVVKYCDKNAMNVIKYIENKSNNELVFDNIGKYCKKCGFANLCQIFIKREVKS